MAVREGLLALLQHEPHYGYQLKTSFESTTGGVWPLNVGQVYTTLDRLERDGLVTMQMGDDEQKLYTITPAGLAELGDWWSTVPVAEPPPRDELMLKVLFAIEQGRDHALAVVTRQRTALTELLQIRRRERRAITVPSRAGPGSGSPNSPGSADDAAGALAVALVTDALIVRAEADLRWLDVCESRLHSMDTASTASRSASTDAAHRKAHS